MPRNPTTGVFTRTSNSFSDPVVGTVIDETDANATFDDYDSGITGSVAIGATQTINPTDQTQILTNLGASSVGKAVFAAADVNAAQTSLGASAIGKSVFAAANATAAQTAINAPGLSAANTFTNTTEATGAGTTAAAIFSGGVEILKKIFVTGVATFKDTTASTSTTTGAVTVAGGIGVAGQGSFGKLSAVARGNFIGQLALNPYTAALTQSDAGIILYSSSANNWAGFGVDNNGVLWARTGLTGTPSAAFGVDATGNVLINLNANIAKATFPAAATTAFITNNITNFVFSTNASATAGQYMAIGGSVWNALSDARIKSKVQTIEPVLDRLDGFRAVTYYNDLTGREEVGVIAQEMHRCFPEFVTTGNDDPNFVPKSLMDEGAWNVSYDRQGAYALQGVKELLALVRDLQAEVADLKSRLT